MDFQEYIRKVYTIAFRLTGDETSAEDVAALAINRNANIIKENIDSSTLHITTKEVCGIFLMEYDKYSSESFYNKNNTLIQNKLMTLEPLSRTAVVWKDIMGYKIKDLAMISNCTKSELYKKLNNARKNLIQTARTHTEGEINEI
ncbi:MAG: hypothetical protein PHG56_07095 [Tissierellia bacterium]|jgi:DNA-directed RNA polymerase specialized sigma24 family protein|nr:hypothetical protein [Tissierellia bacterium]MDD3751967.1 hypothetical protein [Tissierellia bacterium]